MTFTLSTVQVIGTLVVPVLLPVLVGLVTKQATNPGVKAVLLAALSLLTSVLTSYVNTVSGGAVFDLGQALVLTVPTFATAVATHYGLWKPTGVSETVQSVGADTASTTGAGDAS